MSIKNKVACFIVLFSTCLSTTVLAEANVQASLERFSVWLQKNYPKGYGQLNLPATDAQLLKLEALIGRPLPKAFKTLYRWRNGQKNGSGIFFGAEFMSLEEIEAIWREYDGLLKDASYGEAHFVMYYEPQPPRSHS